jgi:hypothetical protein
MTLPGEKERDIENGTTFTVPVATELPIDALTVATHVAPIG